MTAITYSYAFALRNTGQPKVPMFISGCAVLINSILNYALIFGHFNAPELGVRGAAIATVIARGAEMILIVAIVYLNKYPIGAKMSEIFDIDRAFTKKFFKTTLPVICNEMLWALGVSAYTMVYARMGTGVIAAVNIASTVERLAMVLFIGMGHACAFSVLIACAIIMPIRAFNYINIVGVLRGGGDTRFSLILDACRATLLFVKAVFCE